MLRPLINKVVKLQVRLLITISGFLFSSSVYCQKQNQFPDSVKLKREIDSVLAKYGLKSKGFAINVISLSQKGGQTAYSITNNYYGEIKIVQQPELNEWYKQFFIRRIDQVKKDSAITSNNVIIFMGNGSNAGKFVQQLEEFLQSKGYEVDIASSLGPHTGVGVTAGIFFDNKTKVINIYVGNITMQQ
jgi:hypothetical protein